MKVVILYRPDAEHFRKVETFVHDLRARHHNAQLDIVNIDSREGISMSGIYGIMQFPAIIALSADGSMQQMWLGEELPLLDEVAAYIYSPR